jgi:hypothetical protein
MKLRAVLTILCTILCFGCASVATGAPQTPEGAVQAPVTCTAANTVYAHVVALDQPIVNNRMGASLPGGMIFALARDVCAPGKVVNGQTLCSGQTATAGNAILKPYKRPRPMVLRVNQKQCLKIGFTNLLSTTPVEQGGVEVQPTTRATSVHVQGMNLINASCGPGTPQPMCNDGYWVGNNPKPGGLVSPTKSPLNLMSPQIIYNLYAAAEGTFLLYSAGDAYTNPPNASGDGGQLSFGLFGAVNVQPAKAEWYRSQVTAADLDAAQKVDKNGKKLYSSYGQPLIDYTAQYKKTTSDQCFKDGTCRVGPVLSMLCGKDRKDSLFCYEPNEIVHSDLTAMITGPAAGRFPASTPEVPTLKDAYSLPDRLQPYREFTIIYHEMFNVQQAFPVYYKFATATGSGAGQDQFGINYGMGGIGSEILANRLGVGPMANCPTCKYEEFFLTSWAVGDPAMVVDIPATDQCKPALRQKFKCDPNPATKAFYPDDPSNVYHSYISDHTKFRILHGGSDLHHVHHQHAHQWLHSPDTSNGDYLDSQSIGPGSSFSLEMTYNASGNVNQTVGDSIFHCHFYPHFAGGMWSLWRTHDVYETGTELDAQGKPVTSAMPGIGKITDTRALPDGEIATGTPIPGLVPLPTIPMPPMPAKVILAKNGTEAWACNVDAKGTTDCRSNLLPADGKTDPKTWKNPGFPFYIPGLGGQRAPHPPLDFAYACSDDPSRTCTPKVGQTPANVTNCKNPVTARCEETAVLDGGLPRHLIRACAEGPNQCSEAAPIFAFTDFSKTLIDVDAFKLPETGTFVEQVAMNAHSQRFAPSATPENCPNTVNGYNPPKTTVTGCPSPSPNVRSSQFILNGLPPVAGAPFADPCIQYDLDGGRPAWHAIRSYQAADIQLDVTFNKAGWHFPQQRMLSLWGDVQKFLTLAQPPEPFFFRANSGDCIQYTLANLVPNVYELDDFQVRTPTDIIGQHIHLVKFDVTSSDGATNGFNYEDGTFSPNEVMERIGAINQGGGLRPDAVATTGATLTAKPLSFFGPGPGGQWVGAQATIQRWYTDRLFDGTIQKPGVDRTLRTVFTHDHFGPSTHQQAGLYAGLVIEPEGSAWYFNEQVGGAPFGGDNAQGQPLAPVRFDGGPTSWQAVIETPNIPGQSTPNDSFREFLFEFQDTTLTYEPFSITAPSPSGFCANNGAACTPATASQAQSGCSGGAVCYGYGFCSNSVSGGAASQKCTTDPVANYVCGNCVNGKCQNNSQITCGGTSTAVLSCNVSGATCNLVAGVPSSTWGTTPLDNGAGVELITLGNGTNSFSVNYRNEPLFLRIDDSSGTPSSVPAGDLSYAYASIDRPNQTCVSGNSPCNPYSKPLTAGVGANDPFTPLLRAYAGDDVQIRTLVGAHINPHNFTVHGVKWLEEPSFVDSGWRNSQVMGISEHFEEVFKLPAVTGAGDGDYLYMAGAAASEQAGGNWGLMRAYASTQPALRRLPQNQTAKTAPVCPGPPNRKYTVVALTAAQALSGGQLVYNTRGPIADPNAILYFQLQDLNCTTPSTTCKAKGDLATNPQPLVLRANAGDCMQVTLYNMTQGTLGTGAQSPINYCVTSTGQATACDSNTSPYVGLHPQLVTFDVTNSNGFNVGNNLNAPGVDQVVPSGGHKSYLWYAGNVDPKAPAGQQHIPIEFGAANLLPSDTLNHHQYGLFGALVIEPKGSSCIESNGNTTGIENCRRTTARIHVNPLNIFREHVLITQDGLQGPVTPPTASSTGANPFQMQTAFLGGDNVNAVNYRSEPLFIPGTTWRQCSATDSSDLSCVLSTSAYCCTAATSSGGCTFTSCQTSTTAGIQTPIFSACPGEQVRFRVLQGGGVNTNNVFELTGHVWQEQPYVSTGAAACRTPTTQTNLYSSSTIGTVNGCNPIEQDTFSEFQGSRMGHGPTNHFDVLIPSAGGVNKVPGDYLYRSYPAMHFRLGLWGVFRVTPNICGKSAEEGAAGAGGTTAGGAGR